MYLTHFFALILASVPAALAQTGAPIQYVAAHNTTPIYGTWASGSKNVVTGSGFANPANLSFTYPATTGVSYSFSSDGYYEVARYRFNGNGSQPNCITGVINWVHGKYQLVDNGSIILNPWADGYQQIQDPCVAVSNFIEQYNDTELYQSWQIFTDPVDGYKLHLFGFDGTPVAPLFQVSVTPNMLPTQPLRNTTPPGAEGTAEMEGNQRRSMSLRKKSAGERRWSVRSVGTVLGALGGVSVLALAL